MMRQVQRLIAEIMKNSCRCSGNKTVIYVFFRNIKTIQNDFIESVPFGLTEEIKKKSFMVYYGDLKSCRFFSSFGAFKMFGIKYAIKE